ncbi:MAG: esterase [Proteobacteria bacterium]|nr:esterase [Pseudomonadota bacterium]
MHPMFAPQRVSGRHGAWACGLSAVILVVFASWLPPAAAADQPKGLGGGPAVAPAAPAASAPPLAAVPTPRPRIGLVLSGGGARGAAHIGVLKVLEELRVPVDVIAGTSMGSIVGGSYASGQTVAAMTRDVANIKTDMLARDQPPRSEISIHLKQEDWLDYIGPQFGYRDGSLQLPKGAITGVALEAVLRELALAKGDSNFDKLPIPFRAIATDVVSGQMTVLRSGDLAIAMRASMSVPGAIAPVQIDGKMLVDGGLTRNLPVDVARAMGADVIIAVNLGTPLLKRDQINSALSVAAQMLNILTEQNVQASLATLKPTDVLILPELGSFSAGDFDNMPSTIPIGEAAARKVADQLRRYSLPPQQYAAHRLRQVRVVAEDSRRIDEIRVEGLSRVNEEVVIQSMETRAGAPLDVSTLDLDMRRIYGRGDFEHVSYKLIDEPDHRILAVEAVEKAWGPTYVRFGLSLYSDFQGDNAFNLLASIRRTWVNHLGGEWRADVQLGNDGLLFTEFYQPLVANQYFFIAPRAMVTNGPADIFGGPDGDDLAARYNVTISTLGLDLGSQFTKYGELRVGLVAGRGEAELQIGSPILAQYSIKRDIGAVRTRLYLDQIDSTNFPRSGYSLDAQVLSSDTRLGASDTYNRWSAYAVGAKSFGAHTFQFALAGGGSIGGNPLPLYDYLNYGGFMRMTGYRDGQLRNDSMSYGRITYMNQLFKMPLLEGVYAGASIEAARLGDPLVPTGIRGNVASGSLFLAVDTPLGPAYLAYGHTYDGNSNVYFYLGKR